MIIYIYKFSNSYCNKTVCFNVNKSLLINFLIVFAFKFFECSEFDFSN